MAQGPKGSSKSWKAMRSRRISANLCQEKCSQGGNKLNKTNYLLLNEMFLHFKTLGAARGSCLVQTIPSSDMHKSYVISGVFNSFKPSNTNIQMHFLGNVLVEDRLSTSYTQRTKGKACWRRCYRAISLRTQLIQRQEFTKASLLHLLSRLTCTKADCWMSIECWFILLHVDS